MSLPRTTDIIRKHFNTVGDIRSSADHQIHQRADISLIFHNVNFGFIQDRQLNIVLHRCFGRIIVGHLMSLKDFLHILFLAH